MVGKSWGPAPRSAGGAIPMDIDRFGLPSPVLPSGSGSGNYAFNAARAALRLAMPIVVGRGQELMSDYARVGADIISGRLRNEPGSNGMNPSLRGTTHRLDARVSHAAQTREATVANARLRGTPGSGTPMTQNMKPAQLIPGRGAELFVNQSNIEMPIRFKTGEKSSAKRVDAYARERNLYKSQSVAHAFAFKCLLTDPSFIRTAESLPVNRFVVHNVFRHNMQYTVNTENVGEFGTTSTTWNNSLGPDRALVRQQPPTGTAYSTFDSTANGLNVNLSTPFRYPNNGGVMWSRMNRQTLENLGWNANPLKFRAIEPGIQSISPGMQSVSVYGNAGTMTSITTAQPRSLPNLAPTSTVPARPGNGPSFFYKSQMGIGSLNYNFVNDGLNPVVVDVVITRLKKGQEFADDSVGSTFIATMVDAYQKGYMNYMSQNQNQANFQGETPQVVDVTTNARGPFLPAKSLGTFYRGTGTTSVANLDAPFKQVARDQFILAGGGSREWSMKLQALDYDARRYNQADFQVDDLSYCVSFGISGIPLPYIEVGSGGTSNATTIIDRRGTACNVNVTGLYSETVHPVYMSRPSTFTYVNGTLDVPGYSSGTAVVSTSDIANLAASTRTTTVGSAIMNVSPFNTIPGA